MFVVVVIGICGCAAERESGKGGTAPGWRDTFTVNKADLAPTGNNSYLPIQPGKELKLAHGKDRLTVSILPETKTVDGVSAGVLEEREEKNGKLIEVSRNFFATDRTTGDVYYFGEDVDNYNLQQCYDEIPELRTVEPLTLLKSLDSLFLALWDERSRKMVTFRALRA